VCCTSVGRKKERKKEKRKEVFDIRKRRKGIDISTYQLEGTLVLDTPLAVVYICVDHTHVVSYS
jgi:hypothetical protein